MVKIFVSHAHEDKDAAHQITTALESEPGGCVALRPLSDAVCEMKRLYVRPGFRGQRFGRSLAERVISDARTIGYSTMVLDTLPIMRAALGLYHALGFTRRSAYYDSPCRTPFFWSWICDRRPRAASRFWYAPDVACLLRFMAAWLTLAGTPPTRRDSDGEDLSHRLS